jgi:hypothetical protein
MDGAVSVHRTRTLGDTGGWNSGSRVRNLQGVVSLIRELAGDVGIYIAVRITGETCDGPVGLQQAECGTGFIIGHAFVEIGVRDEPTAESYLSLKPPHVLPYSQAPTRPTYSRSRLARLLPLLYSAFIAFLSIHNSSRYSMPLQIAIVGAGIAGLSAAIGLRRAGHDAVVGLLCSLTMRN